ncbi:hypothetical protein AVEN_172406-1, partial [Araneus ventricosus]
ALHLSLLVACAFGEYTKGLSGKFPKLEDVRSAVKKAEARSLGDLKAIPEAKSDELLGFGFGDALSSIGADGSFEKSLNLPEEFGKDLGLGFGFSNDAPSPIDGLSEISSSDIGEGYGLSARGHGHGHGHGGHGGGHGHGHGHGHGDGHGHGHGK